MAILNVVYFPDDPLTKKASAVDRFDEDLAQLAEDMLDTMHAYEGVGLAAPQIGLSRRMFVMQEPEGPEMCIVNPEIYEFEGREEGEEGCLSMPQVYAQVPRATRIKVRGFDVAGNLVDFEALDFLARIIQHEADHLDGILFPERLDVLTRQAKLAEWKETRERLLNPEARERAPHAT